MFNFVLLTAASALLAPPEASSPNGLRLGAPDASWQLDFEFTAPQRIHVSLPGQAQPQLFWYMLYKATNNTGRERIFFPTFELVHQTPDSVGLVQADMGINPAVFAATKQRHAKGYPFLIEPVRAIGRLLQGEDNAVTSVAIWPAFDDRADRFSIYVAGLSGQTQLVPNPNYDPALPEAQQQTLPDGTTISLTLNPRLFTLRKTLKIEYQLPGDPLSHRSVSPVETAHAWVMR